MNTLESAGCKLASLGVFWRGGAFLQRQEARKGHMKGAVRLFKCRASADCIASKNKKTFEVCLCLRQGEQRCALEFEAIGRSIFSVCVCVSA